MGFLLDMTFRIEGIGARHLGSSPEAVALAGDKGRLAAWLADHGVDTPPCHSVNPYLGLPPDAAYPAVIKPHDGAGTIDTYFVEDADRLPDRAARCASRCCSPT